MVRSRQTLSRRGRRPSLTVAARRVNKLQKDARNLLDELLDLEKRLVRLEALLEASRKAEREKTKRRIASRAHGIRGKGPNVRDIAHQILLRRRKPLGIQELSRQVLKIKKGKPGENFTQNLGAALARDSRFRRVGRGTYTVRR